MSSSPGFPPQWPASAYPEPPSKPGSIITLGIVGIFVSVIGLALAGFGLYAALAGTLNIPETGSFQIIYSVLSLVLHGVLLASSIACFVLAPWGRIGMLVYATAMPILLAVNVALSIMLVLPDLRARNPNAPPGFEAGLMIGFCFGAGLWFVLPILIHSFFHSARVKAAFGDGGTGFPVMPPTYPQ